MSNLAAVVLAAGRSTRFRSKLPKLLHPVAGRAMIDYVLEAVAGAAASRVVAVVGVLPTEGPRLRAALGDGVEFAVQAEPLGTGHAVAQARALLDGWADDVMVVYGDTPLVSAATLRGVVAARRESGAAIALATCAAGASVATGRPPDTTGLGRIERDSAGRVVGIVETKGAAAPSGADEVNVGVYCFDATWLWPALERLTPSVSGEYYLTDLVALATADGRAVVTSPLDDATEALGVNTRAQLALAEAIVRRRVVERLMRDGVTIVDPATTFIDDTVAIAADTVIQPHSFIRGSTRIGEDCVIGPFAIVADSAIAPGCRILASVIEESVIEEGVDVGPFSHLRAGAHLEAGVHIGNFAEVKNSRLGRGAKMGHFSYIGDARLGRDVNVGAGAITCNYDGVRKNETDVGDDVFLGSDSLLIAPVRIGDRSVTGAGAVVNRDVPPDTIAVGAPARHRSKAEREGVGGTQ